VTAITKYLIWMPRVIPITVGAERGELGVAMPAIGWIHAGYGEKMMNIDTEAREFAADELTENELDSVSGGQITCHSTNYSLEHTMAIWYYCMGQAFGGSVGIQ
jgi:bacteriocin-like protein